MVSITPSDRCTAKDEPTELSSEVATIPNAGNQDNMPPRTVSKVVARESGRKDEMSNTMNGSLSLRRKLVRIFM